MVELFPNAIRNPKASARKATYFGLARSHDYIRTVNKHVNYALNGMEYNPNGINVFEEDWDNLLLLDACRFDMFRQVAVGELSIHGELESRQSRGACSPEFVLGNFGGRELHDVVYLTANSWYQRLVNTGELGLNVHYHELTERDSFEGQITKPSRVTKRAKEIDAEFPNKRLVVHYFQPHPPFFTMDEEERFGPVAPSPWHLALYDVSVETLVGAFETNLRLVIKHVNDLVADLHGKTVISADHGELFGERVYPIPVRSYGHPYGIFRTELTKVPWYVIPADDRKEIVSEKPLDTSHGAVNDVKETLRALGYI